MQRIPQSVIEEVRQKADIVDVIGQYVQLKKAGKNYSGLCPFHQEKTPSFTVTKDKQIFKCFGCGKGGNVFTFLQELEGITFPEAVVKVAEFAHVPLEGIDLTPAAPVDTAEAHLIELHEEAAKLYQHILLNTEAGAEALEYLTKRGLDTETIKHFQLGYAPASRTFLTRHWQKNQKDHELMRKSGLFNENQTGELSDRFSDRIMFPLTNPQGKVVGFSGRRLADDPEQPKYLNSPESLIFNKGRTLYHFHEARGAIRKAGYALLLEGYMDVIAAWQAGLGNGFASMGTSLTDGQIHLIEGLTSEVRFCYDGDAAGLHAIDRGIGLLKTHSSLKATVVLVPDKMDPDEYFRKYGSEALVHLIDKQLMSPYEFKLAYLRTQFDLDRPQEKLAFLDQAIAALAAVDSLIEQDMYIRQLADEFSVDAQHILSRLKDLQQQSAAVRRPAVSPPHKTAAAPRRISQIERAEQWLLYYAIKEAHVRDYLRQLSEVHFLHEPYERLYLLIDSFTAQGGVIEPSRFVDLLNNDTALLQIFTDLMEMEFAESTPQVIDELLFVIQQGEIQTKIEEKQIQQKEAKQMGNADLEFQLTIDIIKLRKQLSHGLN